MIWSFYHQATVGYTATWCLLWWKSASDHTAAVTASWTTYSMANYERIIKEMINDYCSCCNCWCRLIPPSDIVGFLSHPPPWTRTIFLSNLPNIYTWVWFTDQITVYNGICIWMYKLLLTLLIGPGNILELINIVRNTKNTNR